MIAVKALYKRGKIEFLDPPPNIERSLVAIVFLEMETVEDALAPYLDSMNTAEWGQPIDEEGAEVLLAVHEELAPYRLERRNVATLQRSNVQTC